MGTLVCTIELDKNNGITVQVVNSDDSITSTVHMDGKKITTTVKGSDATSTIVQEPATITVTCKDFILDTETITMKSSKASSWKSQDTLSVESTKDMTLKSSAKWTTSATQDAKLSSTAKVDIEATQALSAKGMTATVEASAGEAKVSGLTLKLEGKTQAELSGAMTKVAAQGMLDLESSGMANLKGSMTSVSGNLVKLG